MRRAESAGGYYRDLDPEKGDHPILPSYHRVITNQARVAQTPSAIMTVAACVTRSISPAFALLARNAEGTRWVVGPVRGEVAGLVRESPRPPELSVFATTQDEPLAGRRPVAGGVGYRSTWSKVRSQCKMHSPSARSPIASHRRARHTPHDSTGNFTGFNLGRSARGFGLRIIRFQGLSAKRHRGSRKCPQSRQSLFPSPPSAYRQSRP